MHRSLGVCLAVAGLTSLVGRGAPANEPIPVVVTIVGKGTIRLQVADGTSLPCDASSNRILFDAHAKAGDRITLASQTGSVCVDHTYGEFRESQWAGGVLWSGARWKPWGGRQPEAVIRGAVPTDRP